MPYVITTVALSYDPVKWFSGPIEFYTPDEWDHYTRYGKMHFIYDYSTFSFTELQKKFTPGRLLFILRPDEYIALIEREKRERPDEFKLENSAERVIHKIYSPEGNEVLWLCRF
jgi:hypothetical protein